MAIPMLYAFLVVNIYLRHGAELCSLKLHNLIWYKYRWRMVVPIILVLGLVFTYGLLVHPILVSTVFVPNLALAESGEPLDTAKLAMLFSPTVILLILLPALVLFFGVPGRISSQEFTTVRVCLFSFSAAALFVCMCVCAHVVMVVRVCF